MDREYEVILTKFAQKQFRKLPAHIQKALRVWSEIIEEQGISVMRKIPGYHDEPLKGDRREQRSSRLSLGYRVFYEETASGEVAIISVLEVNKHDY
jgi:proteic killer suppression protein